VVGEEKVMSRSGEGMGRGRAAFLRDSNRCKADYIMRRRHARIAYYYRIEDEKSIALRSFEKTNTGTTRLC